MNARRVIEVRARILAREAPRGKQRWFFDYFSPGALATAPRGASDRGGG